MAEYEELIKALRERALRENEWYEHGGDIIEAAAAAIEELQAQLPKRGEWIRIDKHTMQCCLCHRYLDLRGVNAGRGDANYCPNCGAKMEAQDGQK